MRFVLAFFAIYIIWGSTYLSIRIVVSTVPPLFAAGARFAIAGITLLIWAAWRGVPMPSSREWRNLAMLAALMFLAAYGGLFWAEKTLPSGVASVLVATIPVWTALMEIFIFKRERMSWPLVSATVLGLAGVSILALGSFLSSASGKVTLLAYFAILGAEISWSFGTVLSKSLSLPESKVMSSGAEMAIGGAMLLAASACAGEMHPFPHFSKDALAALAYLIVAGSLLAFTAYVWLLSRLPATRVATYAFVNPVVALAIGHWLGGEAFGLETMIGSGLILGSVILILRARSVGH